MNDISELKNRSAQYLNQGLPKQALEILADDVISKLDDPDLYNNKAIACIFDNNKTKAIEIYKKLITKHPNYTKAYASLGNLYSELNETTKAFNIFESAINKGLKDIVLFNNYAAVLYKIKQPTRAIVILEQALELGDAAITYKNLSISHGAIGNLEIAIQHIKTALNIIPEDINCNLILAQYLKDNNDYQNALTIINNILLKTDNLDAKILKAHILIEDKQQELGANILQQIYKPNMDKEVLVLYLLLKFYSLNCYVEQAAETINRLKNILNEDNVSQLPETYYLFLLFDQPKDLAYYTKIFAKEVFGYITPKFTHNKQENKKIRLGYASADFNEHAVGFTLGNIFKYHDKSKFEIIGVLTYRELIEFDENIIKHFDEIIHIPDCSSQEKVAQKINSANIDILIDLSGYCEKHIMGALAFKPCPIQCHWMGFPGTTGTNFIDCFITDEECVSRTMAKHYPEKIVYLNTFVTAPKLKIPEKIATREKYNLPTDKFIFCSHIREYRLNYEILATWIEILQKTTNSILWLSVQSEIAQNNIINLFNDNGINKDRVFISPYMILSRDFAPIVADLWLDGFIMTSGVGSLVCANIGLPVLTLQGNTQHKRTGAAIMHAAGLDKFVAKNKNEYIKKAIYYANNKEELDHIKKQYLDSKDNSLLFSHKKFIADLEQKLTSLLNL